jgi:hypothetical protein
MNHQRDRHPNTRAKIEYCLRISTLAIAGALAFGGAASAAPVVVPNADFATAANNGNIGGGLIGGSGSGPIGSGPWQGSYTGVLALLAPPTLTIGMGNATVTGLAGVNVLGLVNNGGSFRQTLSTNFLPNKRYLISADVDTGSTVGLSLLGTGNAGLALASGATRVASTATAAPSLITVVPISGTVARVTLSYATGPTASGPITVLLLAEPTSLLTVNLANTVRYDNVTLSATALNPVPASIAPVNSSPQGVPINTAFPSPLQVQVLDPDGDPVPGAVVTFTVVSGSGAGATLSSATATTGANGVAQVTATSNSTVGSYTVQATVAGVAGAASFPLNNISGVPASLDPGGGTPQSATVAEPFATPLSVIVKDSGGNPVQGVTVSFSAPASGPSATISPTTATTDASGVATTNATANTVAGPYEITASVSGTADTASYAMNNAAGPAAQVLPSSGSGQSANVYQPFSGPLTVTVADAYGNPVSGVSVTFTPPASGPGATVSPTTVTTDANGNAITNATANGFPGNYAITASATGVGTPTSFSLTNSADNTVTVTPDGPAGSKVQSAYLNEQFVCKLRVFASSPGNVPRSGVAVSFASPPTGASANLTGPTSSGGPTSFIEFTDANGIIEVTAVANENPGDYVVLATMVGSGNPPIAFNLRNIDPIETVFRDGFGDVPVCVP